MIHGSNQLNDKINANASINQNKNLVKIIIDSYFKHFFSSSVIEAYFLLLSNFYILTILLETTSAIRKYFIAIIEVNYLNKF